MKIIPEDFERNGYVVVDQLIEECDVSNIELQLSALAIESAGTRNLLGIEWCALPAQRIKHSSTIGPLLPQAAVAVQCTYFEKTADRNWLVALHRDRSIPVARRIKAAGWAGWSEKEGVLYTQPPAAVLECLVIVRVHLEDNTELNSPLQVIPGSHIGNVKAGARVLCLVGMGGALVMRPLILHASSKLKRNARRVLHFLFGPASLPDKAEWAYAV